MYSWFRQQTLYTQANFQFQCTFSSRGPTSWSHIFIVFGHLQGGTMVMDRASHLITQTWLWSRTSQVNWTTLLTGTSLDDSKASYLGIHSDTLLGSHYGIHQFWWSRRFTLHMRVLNMISFTYTKAMAMHKYKSIKHIWRTTRVSHPVLYSKYSWKQFDK